MALAIFIGGIFLGFMLGFTIMALVAAGSLRLQSQGVQEIGDYPACAYSPIRKFRPSVQASGAWLTPRPGDKSRLHRRSLAQNAMPPRQD